MYVINIVPVGNICMEYNQSMHMYLTHLVEKYPTYAHVAKIVPGYKILDNSLIELGGAVNIQRVLEAAEIIQANEIILPDVFQDYPGTIKAVEEALHYLHNRYGNKGPYKLMAVAQGCNLDEWIQCYEKLLTYKDIDVIGIPKVCAKMMPGGRPEVMNFVEYTHSEKKHHLLGLWYSIEELNRYKYPVCIRSCDTVLASFLAKHQLGYYGIRPDGFSVDLENDVIDPVLLQKYIAGMFGRKGHIEYGKY